MMHASLSRDRLADYLQALLAQHIPDGYRSPHPWSALLSLALERAEHCFSRIHRKYFCEDGVVRFDHLNGDQFAAFLYFVANTVWRETGDTELPTRLFYLNKILHGLDLYFAVPMPAVFRLVHPLGTVLGRAEYDDYLVVYQNCSVGADEAGIYPRLGKGCILYSRSSLLGDCQLGDDVVLAANSFLLNTDVPAGTVVVGQYPAHRFVANARSVRARCFDPPGAEGEG